MLVSGEVALTLVLAVGAGLLLKSLLNLGRVDLGFDHERLVSVRVSSLPQIPFDDDARRVALYGRFVEAVAAVPGVGEVRVNLVWTPPWDRDRMTDEAKLELGLM
jgi:hypothetical protein